MPDAPPTPRRTPFALDDRPFRGAKLALLSEGRILAYLRDHTPGIPHPGCWDLPGGGREGREDAVACALRELEEEFGLRLGRDRIAWARFYPASDPAQAGSAFLGGQITPAEIAAIRFGDEGQFWRMMDLAEFLTHPLAIESLVARLGDWLGDVL